jgi:hypothetical protein
MKYNIYNKSNVNGINIIEIAIYSLETLNEELVLLFENYNPCYVYVEILSDNLKDIHLFEDLGFRFSEFRINATSETTAQNFNTISLYPYTLQPLSLDSEVNEIENFLLHNKLDDRFSTDYCIQEDLSVSRNISNIKKSIESPDEFLFGVYNSYSKELISFISGVFINKQEVLYYQQGVISKKNIINDKDILNILTIKHLNDIGVNFVNINIAGHNLNEINLFINKYKFSINSSKVLLRKIR